MIIYALVIEPLAINIKNNADIKGITIPNYDKTIKIFQHADDCSAIIQTNREYNKYIEEFKNFGKASGSKINQEKSEILLIGTHENTYDLPVNNIKKQIKILGITYGENSIDIDIKKNIQKHFQHNKYMEELKSKFPGENYYIKYFYYKQNIICGKGNTKKSI